MQIHYSVWDPMGNITVLVTSDVPVSARTEVAAHLLKTVNGAEQVGFFDLESTPLPRLEMAGGEFCGNATMSAAAMLISNSENFKNKENEEIEISLAVSGSDEPVSVFVEQNNGENGYICTVSMPLPATVEIFDTVLDGDPVSIPLVRMPGIAHFVVQNSITADEAEGIQELLRKLAEQVEASAYGMIFTSDAEQPISPLLYVPAADTMIWENACGSGSAAVAAWLAAQHGDPVAIRLLQPGGDTILARAKVTMTAPGQVSVTFLSITGSVRHRETIKTEFESY